jgi:polyhydroxybutyrate depolymerase
MGWTLAALPASGGAETRKIASGDATREYILYRPGSAAAATRVPLVVALHGGLGTAEQMQHFSRFNAVAAREGFAVAYPQGVSRRWNDGRVFRGRGETDADDVAFIRAVVADIDRNAIPLDRRRIYATGISNGGFMSFRLACEAADLFTAVAPVTATMADALATRCRPSAPVSVLVINGTADPLVPYAGGHVRGPFGSLRGAIWSTDRSLDFWVSHNRCGSGDTRVLPDRDANDGSRVIETKWQSCARSRVQLLRIEGGGHTWPGSIQYLPAAMIGPVNRDFDATEAIWAFFRAAPLR